MVNIWDSAHGDGGGGVVGGSGGIGDGGIDQYLNAYNGNIW